MPDMPGDPVTTVPESPESSEAQRAVTAAPDAPTEPEAKKPRRQYRRPVRSEASRKRSKYKRIDESRPGKPKKKAPYIATDEQAFAKATKSVIRRIRMGLAEYVAAKASKISPRTHRKWKADGAEAYRRREEGTELTDRETRLADYFEACDQASTVTEERCAVTIQNALEGFIQTKDGPLYDPQVVRTAVEAARVMLTMNRRFNSRWGAKARHEVTGKGGGPIKNETTTRFTLNDVDAVKKTIAANEDDDDADPAGLGVPN